MIEREGAARFRVKTVWQTTTLFFLAAFVLQTAGSMRLFSASSDETSHLPAGYTYLVTGDFRLNPQHPPLAKLLSAAPLLALSPRLDLTDPSWSGSPPDEWRFGQRFLYANDADRLLFWGRLPMVALGVVLGVYTWLYARDQFGESAGAMAALLFALCPTIVAHSHLVTMDVGLAAFAVAALYHLRSYALHDSRAHLLASGVFFGLALATKFSAVALGPPIVLLVMLSGMGWGGPRGNPASPTSGWAKASAACALYLATAALVVWALYAFPRDPLFYWHGMRLVNRDHSPDVPDYLLGQFRVHGWCYYFPLAFLFKTPLPTIGSIGLGAWRWRRSRPAGRLDGAILLLPALGFTVATAALADNMGVRYLLPVHAPLFVLASCAAPWLLVTWPGRAAAAVIATWLIVGAWLIYPDHLAYFNEAVGGPARGPLLLDDSNIDWGQDLKRLKRFVDDHRLASVRLLYPWNGSPRYYGIASEPVTRADWLERPRPGVYPISTMALVRGRLTARSEGAHSDWLDRYRPVDRVGYSFYIYAFGAPPP